MDIAFFKVTCLICWKHWEAPKLSEAAYGEELLIESKTGEFKYFSWFDNIEIEETLKLFFANNFEMQVKNDYSKGGEARKLIPKIADGEHFLLTQYKCPRCKMRLVSISDTRTRISSIDILTFADFEQLNQQQQLDKLNQIAKDEL